MTPRTRFLLGILLAGIASVGALYAQAQKKPAIAYPKDFRKWTHVKSMVIFDPTQDKRYQGFEGLHNVYVNDIGWPALERGKTYPDGSMFAFELFARRNSPARVWPSLRGDLCDFAVIDLLNNGQEILTQVRNPSRL